MYEPFTTQSRLLTIPIEKPFENIVGKGENAAQKQKSLFELHLISRLQMLWIWCSPKKSRLVKS